MASPALMLLYNNVAELRQNGGAKTPVGLIGAVSLAAAAEDLDIKVADFLT